MKRPSGSISGGGGGSPGLVHSDDGFGMEEAKEDMVSDMVPSNGFGVKKRRLRTEQVRALERSFETDNKLEPERKAALARDLGLQPRQVAVWFQNRRARWKTKKLERDYFALRHSYDALRADHDAIRRDKDALLHEIKELKAKLGDEDALSWVKEEPAASDVEAPAAEEAAMAAQQGSSDSDSSGVVNDAETAPDEDAAPEEPPPAVTAEAAVAGASSPQLQVQHGGEVLFHGHGHGHLLLKVEEDEAAAFLGNDDAACGGFFADLQPPPSLLPWWTEPTDHWA